MEQSAKEVQFDEVIYEVTEIQTIVRTRHLSMRVPKGRNGLRAVKTHIRENRRSITWDTTDSSHIVHRYKPIKDDTDHEPHVAKPPISANEIANGRLPGSLSRCSDERYGTHRVFFPTGTGPAGQFSGTTGDYLFGTDSPDDNPSAYSYHGRTETGCANQEICATGLVDLPGGRKAVQEPQEAPSKPLQHDTRRVPREVGPASRLPDGGTELRPGAVGLGEEDGAGPAQQAGTCNATSADPEGHDERRLEVQTQGDTTDHSLIPG